MKKFITAIALLFSVLTLPAAEKLAGGLTPGYVGPMLPYNVQKNNEAAAWNDTLQPVFVSYTARHGARYLTSAKKFKELYEALKDGEKANALTPAGVKMNEYADMVMKYSEGKWGLLSEIGIKEEQELGEDMAKLLPTLFKKSKVNSESTTVPRVVMTMYQFMHALEIPNQTATMVATSSKKFDKVLRGFTFYKPNYTFYEKGSWIPIIDKVTKKYVSTEPAKRLFKKGFIKDDSQLRAITMGIYSLIQGHTASGYAPLPEGAMTEKEFYGCWMMVNYKHYLRNGITPLSSTAAIASAPLLKKIIADIDAAVLASENGKLPEIRFEGNFGHAETLLPLFSLMRLPGCYMMSESAEEVAKYWRVQDITPLGANLAIVLLRSKSGNTYVSIRHNGRNVPANNGMPIIAPWSTVKAAWESYLPAAD